MQCTELTCVIGAIPKNERSHYEKLKSDILKWANQANRRENENGITFTFSNRRGLVGKLGEWISYEQMCCPFFEFNLLVAPRSGPVSLNISGPPGAKDFLDSLVKSERAV